MFCAFFISACANSAVDPAIVVKISRIDCDADVERQD